MQMKKEPPRKFKMEMMVRTSGSHLEAGFFLRKKGEAPNLSAPSRSIMVPSQAKPSNHAGDMVGWIDFLLTGEKAVTCHITPSGGKEAYYGMDADQLALMRLVFLDKSIKAIACEANVRMVGISSDPSDYTKAQMAGIGIFAGKLYAVKRFTGALSKGISELKSKLGG